jgi:hypothetical protein
MTFDGNRSNVLHYWGPGYAGLLACCDAALTYSSYSQYMYHYVGVALGGVNDAQTLLVNGRPVFESVLSTWGKSLINHILHPSSDPYDVETYEAPNTAAGTQTYFPNYADRNAAFSKTSTLYADVSSAATSLVINQAINVNGPASSWDFSVAPTSIKVDNEIIAICSYAVNSPTAGKSTLTVCSTSRGGRGLHGTVAAAHTANAPVSIYRQNFAFNRLEPQGGYAVIARAALSFLTDKSDGALLGRRAWEWIDGAADWKQESGGYTGTCTSVSNLPYCDVTMWSIVPRPAISNVQVTAAGGGALLRYDAPQGTECRVYLGTSAPATSSDADEPSDGGGARRREFVASGLTAGQNYFYRVSCGTARAAGSFTAGGAGTAGLEVRFAGKPGVRGVAVEHGATAALGTTAPEQPCLLGCRLQLGPLPVGPRYVRWTYLGPAGEFLGQGQMVTMVQ